MRKPVPVVAALVFSFLAAARSTAQGPLTLDYAGGLLYEPFRFTVGGGEPGDIWILAFANTQGPLPIAIADPIDPRSWDLDFSMFYYAGGFGFVPAADPSHTLTNSDPSLIGAHLYAQAFTIFGSPTLVDALSNGILIVAAPGHGASIDTYHAPIQTRAFAVAARLPDGDHMIFGGNDGALQGGTYLKTSERYGRKLQTFSAGPDMQTERSFAASVVLNDGRVLICGGNNDLNVPQASAEIYDPATNTIAPTAGPMSQARYFHSLVKLANGRVAAIGGSTAVDNSSPINAAFKIVTSATKSVEIFDPASGTWSNPPSLLLPRARTGIAAALLPDGRVLVAGGAGPNVLFPGIPEFFKTAWVTNTAVTSWTQTGDLDTERALATTTTLPDGKIMVSGGAFGSIATLAINALTNVAVYNFTSGQFEAKPPMAVARAGHSATYMASVNGVIVCGGGSGSVLSPNVTTAVEAWDGVSWIPHGNTNHERAFHYAGVTSDGERIFLFGGIESGGTTPVVGSAELFAP
jgi:Kelch motif protein